MPGTVSRKKSKKARSWTDNANKSAETVEKSLSSETEEEPVDQPEYPNEPAEEQNNQLGDRNEPVNIISENVKEKKSKKTRARK